VVSTRDLILLALGAILGVLAQQSYDWFIGHYRQRSAVRRADRLRGPKALSALRRQTMRFYRECGLYESLYTPSNLGTKERIPILANDLAIPRALDPYKDGLFYLEDRRSNFPVQERLVRRSAKGLPSLTEKFSTSIG
jgi:hypothetical protein